MEEKVKEAMQTIQEHLCTGKAKGRHLVVLDRGWIFAGNLTMLDDGEGYMLTDCVNIRRWETGGFGGLTKSRETTSAYLDPCRNIKFRSSAMVFCVPIPEEW
jgi:hypothetical protein